MARTVLSPRCSATSSVIVLRSASNSISPVSALNSGGTWSAGNSTSTTGPATRTTRPVPASDVSAAVDFSAVLISVITSSGGQRFRTADDLAEFLGDQALAGLIGFSGEVFYQLGGVVRGGLHRLTASGLLRRRSLQKRSVDPGVDVLRKQMSEEVVGLRLELIKRPRA